MRLLFLIFLCLLGLDSLAQVTLSGRIIEVNSGNKGLSGVQITSPFSKDTVRTDSTGQFEVSCNASVGDALKSLQVGKEGYIVDNEGVFFQYDSTSGLSIYMYDFAERKRFEHELYSDLKSVLYDSVKDSLSLSTDTLTVNAINNSFAYVKNLAKLGSLINFDLQDEEAFTLFKNVQLGEIDSVNFLLQNYIPSTYLSKHLFRSVHSFMEVYNGSNFNAFENEKFRDNRIFPFYQYGQLYGRFDIYLPFDPAVPLEKVKESSFHTFQKGLFEIRKIDYWINSNKKKLVIQFKKLDKQLSDLKAGNKHLLLEEYHLKRNVLSNYLNLKVLINSKSKEVVESTLPRTEKYLPAVAEWYKLTMEYNTWLYKGYFKTDSDYFNFYDSHAGEYGLDLITAEEFSRKYLNLRTEQTRERLYEALKDEIAAYPFIYELRFLEVWRFLLLDNPKVKNAEKYFKYLELGETYLSGLNPILANRRSHHFLTLLLHEATTGGSEEKVKETYLGFEKYLLTTNDFSSQRLHVPSFLPTEMVESYFKYRLLYFDSGEDYTNYERVLDLFQPMFDDFTYRYEYRLGNFKMMKGHLIALSDLRKELASTRDIKVQLPIRESISTKLCELIKAYHFYEFEMSKFENDFQRAKGLLQVDPKASQEAISKLYKTLAYVAKQEELDAVIEQLDVVKGLAYILQDKKRKGLSTMKSLIKKSKQDPFYRKMILDEVQTLLRAGVSKEYLQELMQGLE